MAPFSLRDPVLRPARRAIGATFAGLWAQYLARAFWPLWCLALAVLTALAFELPAMLPPFYFYAAVAATALCALWGLWQGRRFHRPRFQDALMRLDGSLTGRPITALHDVQAIGAQDPTSNALWQAHLAKMQATLAGARPVRPDLRLVQYDLLGLRYLALTGGIIALLFAPSWPHMPLAPVSAGNAGAAKTGPNWEGWARPPRYTGRPTLYLNDLADDITLPKGTEIQLRFYDDPPPNVRESVSTAAPPAPTDPALYRLEVGQNGVLEIGGTRGRTWRIALMTDAPPVITLKGTPARERSGKTKIAFTAKDDYGVEHANAAIALDLPQIDRRYGLAIPPEQRPDVTLDLPLPKGKKRLDFSTTLEQDFSKHPFANLPVTIRLTAQDGQEQTGQSAPASLVLPGKRFFDPFAAAVIELRRDLLWSRGNAARSAQIFRALSLYPDDIIRDRATFNRLKAAMATLERVKTDLTPELRDKLADELWAIALLLEEGDLASARERLERAQQRLKEAMRNGADPAEIQELMEELRQATKDYTKLLAEEAERNPQPGWEKQQQRRLLTRDQIQDMMDEIQRLMKEGRMAEAAEAMDMLQKLLENLTFDSNATDPSNGDQQGPAMRQLQDTLRQQQKLADDAFRQFQNDRNSDEEGNSQSENPEGQNSDGNTGKPSLSQRQQDLRRQLENLDTEQMPNGQSEQGEAGRQSLDEAQDAMRRAENSIEQGDVPQALEDQGQAIDAMRKALDHFNRAQKGQETADDTPGPADPLDRPGDNARKFGSNNNFDPNGGKLPGNGQKRAEELLGYLTKRLDSLQSKKGLPQRDIQERDYLQRLIDLF